ncbi:MAG: hypothetical protein GX837_06725 [Methanomicrobiales archaeon]|jgi:hypothetical protein|nr:hypothetical protein [Methanomicrobiales archaeon]
MLIPITHEGKRLWADISIGCEKYIYMNTVEDLSHYILTNARVEAVLTDEDVLPSITRSVAMLTNEGASLEDAVSRVATCYRILPAYVEEILAPA